MTDADNRINHLPVGTCQPLAKPYVTVRQAAELLGVPIEAVVYDVHEGMDGKLGTLTGGIEGGYWLVDADDLRGECLERHRARLSAREIEGL